MRWMLIMVLIFAMAGGAALAWWAWRIYRRDPLDSLVDWARDHEHFDYDDDLQR